MKIETLTTEALGLIKAQIRDARDSLTKTLALLDEGKIQKAYGECDFDLIDRATQNLEELASETDDSETA